MTAIKDKLTIQPGGSIAGTLTVPGDKSISHRAVMFASLADGVSLIERCLLGEDVRSTMAAFSAMGATISETDGGNISVTGVGIDGLRTPDKPLDMGNSGTSIRLLSGILAGAGIEAELSGDASLSRRPMGRVITPLQSMGAEIDSIDGKPPLKMRRTGKLHAIDYHMPVASAQIKSAILLAGLYAAGRTRVTESAVTRDHTERMLKAFGVALDIEGSSRSIEGGQRLLPTNIVVPSDISSAAFFLVGAALCPGSELCVKKVGVNPTRTGVIDILRLMGADIQLTEQTTVGDEPIADIVVRGGDLRGVDIPASLVPLAIDEFPAIFVAAACADGVTRVTGAEELRVKESDRIAVMADGLQSLGVKATPRDDGIEIVGQPTLGGGMIDSVGDHRIAMAFAIAALRASEPIQLSGCGAIATSFPGFVDKLIECGMTLDLGNTPS